MTRNHRHGIIHMTWHNTYTENASEFEQIKILWEKEKLLGAML